MHIALGNLLQALSFTTSYLFHTTPYIPHSAGAVVVLQPRIARNLLPTPTISAVWNVVGWIQDNRGPVGISGEFPAHRIPGGRRKTHFYRRRLNLDAGE